MNAMQVPLDTPRIHVKDLTPIQVKRLLLKIKKQGRRVLKVTIRPSSAVDSKNGGRAEG